MFLSLLKNLINEQSFSFLSENISSTIERCWLSHGLSSLFHDMHVSKSWHSQWALYLVTECDHFIFLVRPPTDPIFWKIWDFELLLLTSSLIYFSFEWMRSVNKNRDEHEITRLSPRVCYSWARQQSWCVSLGKLGKILWNYSFFFFNIMKIEKDLCCYPRKE